MKAFLLAAGLGTRLRPLTETTPKCLVPIAGRPLLSYWFALLERSGVEEVLINVHHLPDQVRRFVSGATTPLRVTIADEPTLLGSAGTIRANQAWIAGGEPFLIAYADNLTNVDLRALARQHTRHAPLLTMGLFRAAEPSRCGIAALDDSGCVIGFEEKPVRPQSNLANAGVYMTDQRILGAIPDVTPADFGRDVLPGLVGQMHGVLLDGDIIDVGTPDSYDQAQHMANRLGLFEPLSAEGVVR